MIMSALLTADQTCAPSEVDRVSTSVIETVSGLLAGRASQIEIVTACVLAGGHVLIEDVPGVGKTLLAQSLAAAIGGSFSRIQGTADLLPSDIVGSLTPSGDGLGLHFRPGPILANVVLFDELNRVNARTQSALLEVLEEGHVTVDGARTRCPRRSCSLATQNPSAMAGTYALAEGLADRFMAVISLGRATADEEVEILTGRRGRTQLATATAAATLADVATGAAARRGRAPPRLRRPVRRRHPPRHTRAPARAARCIDARRRRHGRDGEGVRRHGATRPRRTARHRSSRRVRARAPSRHAERGSAASRRRWSPTAWRPSPRRDDDTPDRRRSRARSRSRRRGAAALVIALLTGASAVVILLVGAGDRVRRRRSRRMGRSSAAPRVVRRHVRATSRSSVTSCAGG